MKTYTPEQIAKMKDDLDALDGKGRHNVGSNIVRGDGIYANSLERRYEMTIEDMRKLVKANRKPKAAPKKAEAVTIDRIEIHEFISTTADDPAWGRITTDGTRYDGSRVNGVPHIYASEPDVPKDIYCQDKAALICALLNERDHDKIDPAWLRQRAGDFEWRP